MMQDINAFHSSDLPFTPLPERAREAALATVKKQGFISLENYNFASLGENRPVKTNILAFAHPIHRTPEYTGLTVFNAVNDHDDKTIVSLLARTTAPFHLIHRDNEFAFWTASVQDKTLDPHPIVRHISYDQLDNALSEYEVDLNPQRIIDVKQGRDTFTFFREIQPLQLSFWAADITGEQLVNHFGLTVGLLRNSMSRHSGISEEERDILVTTMSIQLLGAIILADTGVLGDEIRLFRPPLDLLMQKAHSEFQRYFRFDLFREYFNEANEAYEILQKICYAGFVPDMLSKLYTMAYSKKERKESGSYDTPLYLTRNIWKNIPVEYLPPQQRVVADMTCGWGSFLVAGYERLAGLKDMDNIIIRNQLYGNDSSPFTAQLAGLGLLLSTSEDSWKISSYTAPEWSWLLKHQPSIIVGNPPFGGDRKKITENEPLSSEKKRQEKANSFFKLAIERLEPGGYLAMIMPRSFTVAEASPRLRQQLLEMCDVLELWELPTNVFSGPTQRTIVIFAQKKIEQQMLSHTPVRTRTIQTATLDAFKNRGFFTDSGLVIDQGMWNEQSRKSEASKNIYLMDYFLILPEQTWREIQTHSGNLSDYAEIMRGATVGKKDEKKRWKDFPSPQKVPWLSSVKAAMPSKYLWWLDYTKSDTIIYPNELKEPCKSDNQSEDKEYLLAGVKVLVPYASDPSWGRRIRVAIERKGYYVSDHFYVVVPKPTSQVQHITYEVIAAVLNWDVSNAWIIEHLRSPAIPKRAMETIPFPKDLSEEDCKSLTQAVLQIEAAAYAHQSEPLEALQKIDLILKRAYHLDETTFTRLRQVKEWDSNYHFVLDLSFTKDKDQANCFISGIVDSVDASKGTITLWIKGFDDLQNVQIVPSMPGWMLRPNAAFRTEIPYKYIKYGKIEPTVSWGAFRLQPYTYLREEELLEGFASLLFGSGDRVK